MEELVIRPEKPKSLNKVLRAICFLGGSALFILPSTFNLQASPLLLKILGIGMVAFAVADPLSMFWKDCQLFLDDEHIKTIDELSIERTAYWRRLDKVILTRFRITLVYDSGAAEQFQLPFISNDEFEKLRSTINDKSETHSFELKEKSWWNIF